MSDSDEYSGHSIWMSELVQWPESILPLKTVSAALFTVGLIPLILTAIFFALLDGTQSTYFVFIQFLAASIAVFGPILIWHYDENVFPSFIDEVSDVVPNQENLIKVIDEYERFFSERYWIISAIWTILITSALVANIGFFERVGVTGVFDPAFFVYFLFAVWWSIITGIGLHGALTTILCIRAVGNLELEIDPLHHDGLGGLSTIGYFSIRATLMNSIGSFALPIGFAIASTGQYQTVVYVAVAAYIGFILISFIYPTLYVNRRAQEVRDDVLKRKRQQIQDLKEDASVGSAGGELSELETQLKIRTLRDDFHEYKSINLYPLSISILTRLASSILLPIGFTLLETYVISG
jgi:uncharacterized membrane protein YciS (DUF1049 family)